MFKSIRLIQIGLLIPVIMIHCISRPPLIDSRQLIVVVTPHWEASHGSLYRFERTESDGVWQPVADSTPVILGRNGMGWGRGLHSAGRRSGPHKQEGDGRSPAGIFKLGDAFGFPSPAELTDLKVPYRPVDEFLECIDDADSRYYTQLLERNEVSGVDWHSSEVIHESPRAYYLGVVVGYNTAQTARGKGSCIFLHCWTAPEDSTAGCTTFDRPEMEKLVRWLDATARPVMVQLPLPVYRRLMDRWQLPVIDR